MSISSVKIINPDLFNLTKTIDFYEIQQAFHGEELQGKKVRCPFHKDRRPSLHVYQDGYKCFSCGAAGDSVSFVAQLYNIRPIEAARIIAERFGLYVYKATGLEARKRTIAAKAQLWEREKALRNAFEGWRWERFQVLMTITKLTRDYIDKYGMDALDGPLLRLAHLLPVLDHITKQLCESRQAALNLVQDDYFRGWAE